MRSASFRHAWPLLLIIALTSWPATFSATQDRQQPEVTRTSIEEPEKVKVTVEGRAADRFGQALGGATIEVRDDAAVLARAEARQDGHYRFDLEVLPGEYQLVATRNARTLASADLRILPVMQEAHVNLDLNAEATTRAESPAPGDPPYTVVKVFYATDRQPTGDTAPDRFFNADRNPGGALQYGVTQVSIPHDHRLAVVETPSIFRFEFTKDPSRHVVLLNVAPQSPDNFYGEMKSRVNRSRRREAFVFVHGFMTSFEDAARSTAQLAYDLQFDGPPVMYSWPSASRFYAYGVAETNAEWTTPHFLAFLKELAAQSGATSIHVVAHSMGNRVVAQALNILAQTDPARLPVFNQVVLAAPDIDADVFRQLSAQITKTAVRVTLYASSNDEALIASKKFHAYPRAGLAGPDLLVLPGIDTVDVSDVDTSLVGHVYYKDSRSVVTDLFDLFKNLVPAAQREHLRAIAEGNRQFWRMIRGVP